MASTTRATNPPSGRGLRAPGASLVSGGRRGRRGPGGTGGWRNRSWGLVTLAALLVLGSGPAVMAWRLRVGEKESVLALSQPVAKGQVIDRGDLVSVSVSGVEGAIPVAAVDTVVGAHAAVDLVQGQILLPDMATADPLPGVGEATIGLALDPSRVPGAGLAPGDVVDVISVPDVESSKADPAALDAPELLAKDAQVFDVGGEVATGGQVLVTLVVDEGDAARVAAYSTQNRVAIVEIAPSNGAGE